MTSSSNEVTAHAVASTQTAHNDDNSNIHGVCVSRTQLCAQLRALAASCSGTRTSDDTHKDSRRRNRSRVCGDVLLWLCDVLLYNPAMSLTALLLLLLSATPHIHAHIGRTAQLPATTTLTTTSNSKDNASLPSLCSALALLFVYVLCASVCVRVLRLRSSEGRVRTLRVIDEVVRRWSTHGVHDTTRTAATTAVVEARARSQCTDDGDGDSKKKMNNSSNDKDNNEDDRCVVAARAQAHDGVQQQQQQQRQQWLHYLQAVAYTPAFVYRLVLAANTHHLDVTARTQLSHTLCTTSSASPPRTTTAWWLQRGVRLVWLPKCLLRRGAYRVDGRTWQLRRYREPRALCKLLDAVQRILEGDAVVLRPLSPQQRRPPRRRVGSDYATTTAAAAAALSSSSSSVLYDDVTSSESDGERESRTSLGGGNSISVSQQMEFYNRRLLLLVWAVAVCALSLLLWSTTTTPLRPQRHATRALPAIVTSTPASPLVSLHDEGEVGVWWCAVLQTCCRVLVALLALLPLNAVVLSRLQTLYANVCLDRLFHTLVARRVHSVGDEALPRCARRTTVRVVCDVLWGSARRDSARRALPLVCAASLVEAFGTATVIAMLDHDGIVTDTVALPSRLLLFLPRHHHHHHGSSSNNNSGSVVEGKGKSVSSGGSSNNSHSHHQHEEHDKQRDEHERHGEASSDKAAAAATATATTTTAQPRRNAQDCCVEVPLTPPTSQRDTAVAICFVDTHDGSRYAAHIHPLCLCALTHAMTPPLPSSPSPTSPSHTNDANDGSNDTNAAAAAAVEHAMEQVRLCDRSYAWSRALHWLPRLCGFADKHAQRFVLRARILQLRVCATHDDTTMTTTSTTTTTPRAQQQHVTMEQACTLLLEADDGTLHLFTMGTAALVTDMCSMHWCGTHAERCDAEQRHAVLTAARVRWQGAMDMPCVALAHKMLPERYRRHVLCSSNTNNTNNDEDNSSSNNDNNNDKSRRSSSNSADARRHAQACVVEHVLVDDTHMRRCSCTRAHVVRPSRHRANDARAHEQQQQHEQRSDGCVMHAGRQRTHSHTDSRTRTARTRPRRVCSAHDVHGRTHSAATRSSCRRSSSGRSEDGKRNDSTRRHDNDDDDDADTYDVLRTALCTHHVLLGLVGVRDTVRSDVQPAMAALDAAGVRCMFFHDGDERRAKSFGARVGLPTDWNCCISLCSEAVTRDPYTIRAQLPLGITAIRRHLQHVDAVPLQVKLFSDARSVASRAMLSVLQDNHEVVVAVGSVLNHGNTRSFTQADVSVGVLPTRRGLAAEREAQQLLPSLSSSATLRGGHRGHHHHHHRHHHSHRPSPPPTTTTQHRVQHRGTSSSSHNNNDGDDGSSGDSHTRSAHAAAVAAVSCTVLELSNFAATAAVVAASQSQQQQQQQQQQQAQHNNADDEDEDCHDVTCYRNIAELIGCSCALRAPPTTLVLPIVVTLVQQARLRLSGIGNSVEFVLHANATIAAISALALLLLHSELLLDLSRMLYELYVFVPLLALSCTFSSGGGISGGGGGAATHNDEGSNNSGGGGGSYGSSNNATGGVNSNNSSSSSNMATGATRCARQSTTSMVYATPDVMRLLRRGHNYFVRCAIVRHGALVWALRYTPSMVALLACAVTASSTLTSYRTAQAERIAAVAESTTPSARSAAEVMLTPDVCAAALRAYVLLTMNVWLVVHCATHVSRHRRFAWRLRRRTHGSGGSSGGSSGAHDDGAGGGGGGGGGYNASSSSSSNNNNSNKRSQASCAPFSQHTSLASPPPLTLYVLSPPTHYARRWLVLNAVALLSTLCVVAATSPVAVWRCAACSASATDTAAAAALSPSSSPSSSLLLRRLLLFFARDGCVPLLLVSRWHALATLCMPLLLLVLDWPLKRWRAQRFAHMQRFRQLSYGTRLGMHSPRGDYEPESSEAMATTHCAGAAEAAGTMQCGRADGDAAAGGGGGDASPSRVPLMTRIGDCLFRYTTPRQGKLELNCVCCDHVGSNSYATYNVATCTM